MSDLIDFAAILGDRLAHSIQGEPITDVYTPTGVGTYLLAAKVSELCPDCVSGLRVPDLTTCHHPNAPTIGRMLAEWQPLVTLAEYAGHMGACRGRRRTHPAQGPCSCGLDAAMSWRKEAHDE